MKKLNKLGLAKLAESDLDVKDAARLGITQLNAAETAKLFPRNRVQSLHFTYYGIDGKKRNDVHRVRLLEVQVDQFGSVPKKPLRYLQPPDSPPAAYFPRNVDWSRILEADDATLYITEGELKAACASKYGYPTIGLGGVWSWRSVKLGNSLIPDLAAIDWTKRDVCIIFDSDASINPAVASACAHLVKELSSRGAYPRVAQLPDVGGEKTGLDDFLVARGTDALNTIIDESEADELSEKLWEFNRRFGFVLSPGMVYDEQRDVSYDPSAFRSTLFANVWADRVVWVGDREKIEKVPVASEWVRWPQRRQYELITYEPGMPRIIDERSLNVWPGWAVEPTKAQSTPWHQLIDLLFTDADPIAKRWFEQWCLYPIAHPGTKMASAIGIWSRPQGVGKSLIGVTLRRIYGGNNMSVISQEQLESEFNTWAARRQFVMVDDVSAYNTRSKADILKKLITQETLLVNEKYVPTYEIPDCCNYYLTSNKENAFYLEQEDRRFFVHEVTASKREPEFYDRYYVWLNAEGPAALMWYAQNEMDFTGFNPYLPPPLTESKRNMIDAVKGELDMWLTELKAEPQSVLSLGKVKLDRDLWTAGELLEFYDQTRRGKAVALNYMGLRLGEYFVPTGPLRIDGRQSKFWIVRNRGKWQKATKKQMIAHIEKCRKKESGGKNF